MSSTDEKGVRRFYREHLLPAAERLRTRGVSFFPLAPDDAEETWYQPPPADVPEFVEVEPEQCEARLRQAWQAQGLPELAALAGPLMALARDLEMDEEQSADVSPFVYVMY